MSSEGAEGRPESDSGSIVEFAPSDCHDVPRRRRRMFAGLAFLGSVGRAGHTRPGRKTARKQLVSEKAPRDNNPSRYSRLACPDGASHAIAS